MYPDDKAGAFMVDFFDRNATHPKTWVRDATFEDITVASAKFFFFWGGGGHFSGPASCMEGFTVRNVTVGGAGEWGVGVQWCGRRERHGGGGQTPTALPWLSHRRDAWSMSRGAARKTLAASFSKFTGEHATRRGTSREGLRRGERETGRNPNVKVQFFCTRVPKDVI